LLIVGGLILAESLNLFKRVPKPAFVLGQMREAADALPEYQAKMMIFGGVGSPGDTCSQWGKRDGDVVTSVQTMLGTHYVERWHGNTWEFYHPGLELQGKVTVRNLERLSCPHWLISGYPSVPELVEAIGGASDLVVEGVGEQFGEQVWVLNAKPNLLAADTLSKRGQPPLLGAEWRIFVSQTTRLPSNIVPAVEMRSSAGISLTSIGALSSPAPSDWRELAGRVKVSRRKSWECDAARPAGIERILKQLRAEFLAYNQSQYPMNPNPDLR
jgi:hypothetical protein